MRRQLIFQPEKSSRGGHPKDGESRIKDADAVTANVLNPDGTWSLIRIDAHVDQVVVVEG